MNSRFLFSSITLLLSTICQAQTALETRPIQPFNPFRPVLSKHFPHVVIPDITVQNMPTAKSQGSLNICYALTGTALVQFHYCNHSRVARSSPQKKLDCTSPETDISPLDLAGWNEPEANNARWDPGTQRWETGGNSAFELLNRFSWEFFSASCIPFEQFANKYGHDPNLEKVLFNNLHLEYEANKTQGRFCEECILKNAAPLFGTDNLEELRQKTDLESALRQRTFEKFLYQLFLGNCFKGKLIDAMPRPLLKYWPPKGTPLNDPKASYTAAIDTIKEVLSVGLPLGFSGVCVAKKELTEEVYPCPPGHGHSLVITGYRKVCTKNKSECRDVLKVHNSGGPEWQKAMNDGWVDAAALLQAPLYEYDLIWNVPLLPMKQE